MPVDPVRRVIVVDVVGAVMAVAAGAALVVAVDAATLVLEFQPTVLAGVVGRADGVPLGLVIWP